MFQIAFGVPFILLDSGLGSFPYLFFGSLKQPWKENFEEFFSGGLLSAVIFSTDSELLLTIMQFLKGLPFLARRTTDEKLLQFRYMYNHKIVGNFSASALKPKNPWVEQFYLGDEYNIDSLGRIYKRINDRKQYYKDNPISYSLERLFNFRGGRFIVTDDNLVLAKSGGKVVSLGILIESLEIIKHSKIKSKF